MIEKCDHIIGMHHHYDELIFLSEKNKYNLNENDDNETVTFFNYCPFCGWKL